MKLVIKGPTNSARVRTLASTLGKSCSISIWQPGDNTDTVTNTDVLIAMNWKATDPPTPNLKLLQIPGAGYDGVNFLHIPSEAWVCNVFEHEVPIAEYCILAMLEWTIRLNTMDQNLRSGQWTDSFYGQTGVGLHGELKGKTLGIIGYGHIGKEISKRAKNFDVRIIVCSRTPSTRDENVDMITDMNGLDYLLTNSDFIHVTCPLTETTLNLIDAREFSIMKKNAVIINVARGAIINEESLYQAVKSKQIAGAIIDTWYRYPKKQGEQVLPSQFPFHELSNVIMSPHSSGLGEGLLNRRWKVINDNLSAFQMGQPLNNVIRRPNGPLPP